MKLTGRDIHVILTALERHLAQTSAHGLGFGALPSPERVRITDVIKKLYSLEVEA
jgi:hypothetical protein